MTASSSTTWSDSFAGDPVVSPPPDWEVVQGRGDWKVDTDAGTSVLHEFNMADMNTENDATLFDGQITAGSQSWSEYDYTFQAKLTTTPYLWYGFPSHYQDTFFAAIFGYQDPHDYFEYRLGYDGTARLIRYSGGVRSVIGSAQSVAFPSTGSYESVKVETTGPDARLYVGGTLVRSDPGLVSGVITGSIGLETSQSDVEFKSIAVAPANLALASTVVASASSTNGDPAHSANAARDGSLSTFWVASGVGANWLEYDLGAVTPITSTTQYWQDTDGSTFKYRIDASNDNSTWTTLSDHCSTGIVGTGQAFNDTVSGSWRYVRMYLCSVNNTHWASSQEFQVFSSPQPVDELNDTASAIAYSGGWSYATSLTGYLSTDAHYSNVVGSSATITFTGTGIEWIGALDVPHGTATVKLDGGGGVCGTPTGTCVINTYAAATQFQQALFNAQGLSRGTHTLEIDITTLYSDIDGFAITA
ncbi:discoidin domain-containing protein [Jatrophihabitans sp.]|uniref:discoidin domain-containing protein n=1 Tax=Jatrophihabitans sp. TaxID=1932789 RepID=UPI0030C75BDD|nr:hypothetical protein [Jatrophihabitans sp.]